jgi:hypothetical protein
MPHNLIGPFCLACRISVEWLLTGIGPTRFHAKIFSRATLADCMNLSPTKAQIPSALHG